jgi:hypothetical protein
VLRDQNFYAFILPVGFGAAFFIKKIGFFGAILDFLKKRYIFIRIEKKFSIILKEGF